jgi:uncharacterized protein YebE (UPF0316 family)
MCYNKDTKKEREEKQMKLLTIFVVCNILNVIIQTVKSIVTIKGSKGVAAWVNALAYGFYTYIVILMVADLPTLTKCLIVGACNLVGVYVVKWAEEKAEKEKIWLVTITVPNGAKTMLAKADLSKEKGISVTTIPLERHTVFNCYCDTKADTHRAKEICKQYNGKMFATENKL